LFLPQLEGTTNHAQKNGRLSGTGANDEKSQRELLGNLNRRSSPVHRSDDYCIKVFAGKRALQLKLPAELIVRESTVSAIPKADAHPLG
jgi:hypothetical protein